MDRRERAGEDLSAMLAALQGWQSQLWTALPCIIQSFDAEKRTVVCASALNFKAQNPDGSFDTIDMPLLVDVPVFFPSGGGCTLTFPIKSGDECLVVFAARCIDAWWQNSAEDGDGELSTQAQVEQRMHSLSDGIAFVGISSVPKVIPDISTDRVELRNDGRTAFISIDPEAESAELTFPGGITINADITHNGTQVTSEDVIASGISLNSHTHDGVEPGGGNTGGPQ